MRGIQLLAELSEATGLPDDLIGQELQRLVLSAGKSTETVTLDELRDLLACYLQEILIQAKEELGEETREQKKSAEPAGSTDL